MAGRFFFGVGPRGEGANQGWAFEGNREATAGKAAQVMRFLRRYMRSVTNRKA